MLTRPGKSPKEAVLTSLGGGNPTALAKLNAGETVLDLGSGGGIDVLHFCLKGEGRRRQRNSQKGRNQQLATLLAF
jgi:hypothetical protein